MQVSYAAAEEPVQDLISIFPLDHYDQNISTWINPKDETYDRAVLTPQQQSARMVLFLKHYIGARSP